MKNYNFLSFVNAYAPYLTLTQIKGIYNQTAGQKYGVPTESYAQIQKAYESGKKGVGAFIPGPLYSGPGQIVAP